MLNDSTLESRNTIQSKIQEDNMTKTRLLTLVTFIAVVAMSVFTTLVSYARRPAMAITWLQATLNVAILTPIHMARRRYPLLEFHWARAMIYTVTATLSSITSDLFWYRDSLTRRLTYSIREIRNAITGLALWLATVQVPFPTLTNVWIYTDDDTSGLAARHDGIKGSPDSKMLSGTRPRLSPANLIAAAA